MDHLVLDILDLMRSGKSDCITSYYLSWYYLPRMQNCWRFFPKFNLILFIQSSCYFSLEIIELLILLPSSAGGLYSGGSAQMVENSLNIHGDEILYVGDHIYTDVSQSKVHLRWRTALICRELEEEVIITQIMFENFLTKNL